MKNIEVKKEVLISDPAYVHMEIYSDGEGAFSLDSKTGWAWYGDTDNFLLGLLRVGDSTVWKKFLDEFKKENITKKEIITAINKSLEKDPSDGLYHLLGDNSAYLGFGMYDEWADIEHELKRCLEREGIKNPDDVTDEIVDKAAIYYQPSTKEVFERMERELTKDMSAYTDKKGSWKDVVNEAIRKCDNQYEETDDFVECIYDELLPLKEDLTEKFYEEYYSEVYKAFREVTDRDLKEISNKTGVDFSKIKACVSEVW